MSGGNGAQDRYIVPALERGLLLLRSFTRERPEAGPGQLAREHGMPRTTVFRLLHTLEAMGFVARVPGGTRYRLGAAVLSLGFEYLSALELPEVARPILELLRDSTGASAHLAIREGDEIVYVSRYASRSALASNIRVGSRLPAHASSMGRVLLADLSADELNTLYGERPLRKFTDQTPADLEALKALLAQDRMRGYVVSRSYFERGVVSVAAPVRDLTGRTIAAINVTAAEHLVDPDTLDGVLAQRVVSAAREISRWLGGPAATPDGDPLRQPKPHVTVAAGR